MRKSANKGPVKIAETQKRADIFDFVGYGPVFNARNFGRVHACYPLFKDYPQVIYGRGMEGALLWFEVQVMVLRNCEDIFNSFYVVRKRSGRSNSNIVHIDSDNSPLDSEFCHDIFVNLIHHCLESCGGVTESKKHDSGLKESISCFERRFVFVAFLDSDVIVSPSYIEFSDYRR